MATTITCPSCGHEFEPNNVIREQIENELRAKMKDWQLKKEEDFRKKESELQKLLSAKDDELDKRLADERKKLQADIEQSLRKSLTADYENQMKMLQQSVAGNEEKLKEARRKEFEYMQKEQQLKLKEEELELNVQKKLIEERERLAVEIRKIEDQKKEQLENDYKLKLAEKDKQLEDQKKLAEEMKRKAEQGSMQLQGEVQELLLENILQNSFPHDKITPVGKGVRGADCIQVVCNPFGNECGKIIYESKRTASFGADWIDKLKADMRSQGADIAVIVTQALPKDMERFGEKDGVYVCTFTEVRSLASVLRTSILKVFQLTKSQENKGDKMHMLYNYLTSHEFSEQWNAIREGFLTMKLSIQKERDAMEKLWKTREKQLEKVLLNAAHIKGSVEGIAGSDAINLNLLENDASDLLD
ncbi:DUF2130 domain-containing protein [Parafilimonas sp.]|uniref:DUF2130 domain-containing protein n=1 Tax=Parafilimonas sp. TaxID=1969739 RepID=UPI0039E60FCE